MKASTCVLVARRVRSRQSRQVGVAEAGGVRE